MRSPAQTITATRHLFAGHLMVGDAVVAVLCFPPIVVSSANIDATGFWAGPATVVMLACWWVPLFWRRSHTEVATAVVMVGHLCQLVLLDGPTGGNITVPIMAYALGRYARNRVAARALIVVGVLGAFVGAVQWSLDSTYRQPQPAVFVVTATIMNLLVLLSAWAFGLLNRQRRLSIDQLRERAQGLERERDQHARLAAEEERTRIAREMHDVVAHSLSVIVVQADGASYAVAHGDPAAASAVATQALHTIGGTAREALADTRRLVAVLRGGEGEAEYTPQAGLADLERLIEPIRHTGRPIDLVVTGEQVALPRDADLAAYRVVQEALTNVIKHAGTWASVQVGITYAPDAVQVTVGDDGLGVSVPDDGRGHGIIGMRERVAAYGGSLVTGPRTGGGFIVHATIPFDRDPPAPTPTYDPAAKGAPDEP